MPRLRTRCRIALTVAKKKMGAGWVARETMTRSPRSELRRIADLLDESVVSYGYARSGLVVGRWEAPLEAFSVSGVCVRNIEAAAVLARTDELLAPAVWANARNAFEIAVRVNWLLHSSDPFQCETRWLAFVEEYERFHQRMARESIIGSDRANRHLATAHGLREFRIAVEAQLPDGYARQARIPSVRDMLNEASSESMYRIYIEASQYLHGSMAASAMYRRNLGIDKQFGDYTSIFDWILPLRVCWLSLRNTASIVIDRLSDGDRTLDWSILEPQINTAFAALADTIDQVDG